MPYKHSISAIEIECVVINAESMSEFSDIIELNVGGTVVMTHHSTLVKDENSMLAAMFSGRHVVSKDSDGRYFIDCDGALFKHILEYLRFGTIPSNEEAFNVYSYAEYFGINDLIKELEDFPAVRSILRKRSYEAALEQDFHLYDELKRNAIKEVETFYSTENILIVITIKLPLEINCPQGVVPCQPFLYGNPKSGISKARADTKVSVSVTSKIYSGWSKCLAFDLRELGFTKYTYYLDSEDILRCKRCSRFVGRIEYILLANNAVLDIDKSGWRKP